MKFRYMLAAALITSSLLSAEIEQACQMPNAKVLKERLAAYQHFLGKNTFS